MAATMATSLLRFPLIHSGLYSLSCSKELSGRRGRELKLRSTNAVVSVRCLSSFGDEDAEISSRKFLRKRADFDNTPTQDAVLQAMAEVSKAEGRTAKTTNLVMGGTASPYGDDWIALDKKVNRYPSFRGFVAIGTGGEDFVQAMVWAVESALQRPIPNMQVRQRDSAQGNYVSVKIGPLRVESSEEVQAVYEAMRQDVRMRYFL